MAKEKDPQDPAPQDQAAPQDRVNVRLLVDYAGAKCNDVASVPADQVESLVASGVADAEPAAVQYALDNGGEIVEI